MTYYSSKDLADSFRTGRKNTTQIAEDIPESQYSFRASPDSRTVAETLAHIAQAPAFQHHVHSNKVDDLTKLDFQELFQRFFAEEGKPRTKTEIVALLKTRGDEFALYIEQLPESVLAEQVAMPPG